MSVSALDLLILAAAATSPPTADCRTIADPSARLACYDARDNQPAAPVTRQPAVASQPQSQPFTPQPARPIVETTSREGAIAAIAPLRRGLFRITLADGRLFDTATSDDLPPAVGTAIKLRRSVIGTTFLDAPGLSPITVRPVRRDR
jgi:hypothetical protein